MFKKMVCFTSLISAALLSFSVNAASWVNNSGNMVADGDVVQNTGFIGSGYTSITVGSGNSANFNNSGMAVDNLGFEVSTDVSIFGDLFHNNGLVTNGLGGFGVLGDNTHITAQGLNVGGNIVIGNGTNSNKLTLNVDEINANDITTNTGSKLIINPNYSINSEMNIVGDTIIADGIYMGDGAIGTESFHINAATDNNTYTINTGDFKTTGFIDVDTGKLIINSGSDIDISGDVSGNMFLNADESITIGGDLGTGVEMSAQDIYVGGDVLGGVKIAFNDAPANGFHTTFERMDLTVNGTYYFDNDSFLQLVLNDAVAGSDGYNPDSDIALITVGGFDASGVTVNPNIYDMTSTPNIEVIVDGIMSELRKIRLLDSDTEITDLGKLNMAGVWFYNSAHTSRFFQEAGLSLSADKKTIFLNVATMRSIAGLVAQVPSYAGANGNDMQMALAIDDLIKKRLNSDTVDGKYSSLMRVMFPADDVYYRMMVNGGAYDDALHVMTADGIGYETDQTYIRAMNYVRQLTLDDVSAISDSINVSGRLIRYGTSDHLMDDFIWQRFHDKGVAWGTLKFTSPDDGGSIISFVGGADWLFNNSFMVGATIGYNQLNFNEITGNTIDFGIYGAYDPLSWARLYGKANIAINSLEIESGDAFVGTLSSDITTSDATVEIGLLHKIFETYLTGRAYVYGGLFGGFKLEEKTSNGQKFMDIETDNSFVLIPGYEIAVGKDIYLGLWSFIRPSLKLGVEYDLIGRSNDLKFKFSESDIYRDWNGDEDENKVWLRYGLAVEFAISQGANLMVGYEILRNGDYSYDSFKLSGSVRF